MLKRISIFWIMSLLVLFILWGCGNPETLVVPGNDPILVKSVDQPQLKKTAAQSIGELNLRSANGNTTLSLVANISPGINGRNQLVGTLLVSARIGVIEIIQLVGTLKMQRQAGGKLTIGIAVQSANTGVEPDVDLISQGTGTRNPGTSSVSGTGATRGSISTSNGRTINLGGRASILIEFTSAG